LKKVFYDQINYPETYYVLNDLFNEKRNSIEDLTGFLNHHLTYKNEVLNVLEDMNGWDGQWENLGDQNELMNGYEKGSLNDLYEFLLNKIFKNTRVSSVGSKEVMIEEFIPYYIQQGIKVILIVRDPRDAITSINVGNGPTYTGAHRPTLFHLRNWRKSIAICNSLSGCDLLHTIRYEDLITEQEKTLVGVTDFLEVDPFPKGHFSEGIRKDTGEIWEGNSSTNSFKGIDKSNKNKFINKLDPGVIKFIEYMCKPEMEVLGYDLHYRMMHPSIIHALSFKQAQLLLEDCAAVLGTKFCVVEQSWLL
jgi:hypothetical protein